MRTRARSLAIAAVVIAGFLTTASAQSLAASDGQPHPVEYMMSARWAPSSRVLTATETIQFRNDGPGALPLIWLRLWANDSIPGEADGCGSPNLTLGRVQGATIARYAVACSAVALLLPAALKPDATATVSVGFTVDVPTDNAQFGRSAGIDLFGRVVPTLAVRDASGWHLNPDTAVGDPAYTLSASWRATVTVPDALEVASTGAKLSDTLDARRQERTVVAYTPDARDFGLAVGRLRAISANVLGTSIKVFYSSRTSGAVAARALSDAARVFRTYVGWYGPYDGSGEYDVVLTKLGLDSQELPEIVFTNPGLDYIAHETAHMWFYGIVGDDQYGEPWLDESFASWNEEQFAPGTYPCNPADPLGRSRGLLSRGLSYFETRPDAYYDVVYRGGSCALTALERMLGRERFLGLLHQEVDLYRYGVIHTGDFMALLQRTDPAIAARWSALVGIASPAG